MLHELLEDDEMDENSLYIRERKIEHTIDALQKNGINGYFAHSRGELYSLIEKIVPAGSSVASGGSMTLSETNVFSFLKTEYNYLEYDHGDPKASRIIFSSDAFLCSANAITEEGEIYNVDGNGNRVAAMIWGPEKVIIVAGANKIVPDLDSAKKRCKDISGPMNAKRLNKVTPCVKTGRCMDCNSPDRICNEYVLIKKQRIKERMHVIFLNEDLGY